MPPQKHHHHNPPLYRIAKPYSAFKPAYSQGERLCAYTVLHLHYHSLPELSLENRHHTWLMNALLALRLCNRGRLLSVRHCLVSLLCRCIVQRLSVTDFMHPCIPTLFDHLYASLHRAFGRSTSGIHARPLPKVSFCC